MRIYTRSGDKGQTSLFGGDRVPKDHPRIEAYGTVDELNSLLGLTIATLPTGGEVEELHPLLQKLQHELFIVGGDLATPPGSRFEPPRVGPDHIEALEKAIDRFDAQIPPLKQFVLPGGSVTAARLHVCRTVCRRAERLVVKTGDAASADVVVYLNRLSDLLFVLARWANYTEGVPETKWDPTSPTT